jgi:predicted DNA-binding helix-hairpin-helix protein
METLDRLSLLSQATLYEGNDGAPRRVSERRPQGYTAVQERARFGANHPKARPVEVDGRKLVIHMAASGGGRRTPLLKAMLTSACERDCYYCPFRAGRNYRRTTLKPDEMAQAFHKTHQLGIADGLFLSTGIFAGGCHTQDKLIETADILRHKLGYMGYLHLKIMPGAEREQVVRAMQLADRVSVNLEAPNQERLSRLAPHKQFLDELMRPLQWIEAIRKRDPYKVAWKGRWPSSATQFVVGAAGESDIEILSTTTHLIQKSNLRRAYFEAFDPVPDTPLESHPAENPVRQQRLYEASFLLRDYDFDLEDMPFEADGRLPLDRDPKTAWADRSIKHAPIELNTADREMLMRVPGIGPKTAEAIIHARRQRRLCDISQLRRLGISPARSAPYILLDSRPPLQQLPLL